MKLEHSFVRAVPGGAPGDPPILGSDAIPVDAAYLALDNVFRCPQYGPNAEPINAVSLAYDGPLGAPTLTFNVYLWDEESQLWFDFGTVDIVVGEIKFISLPNIVDRKDSRQVSRIAVAFVSNNPLAPAAGTYTFLSSAVTGVSSLDPSAFAGIIAVLNLILADTTSIDGKLENPMPVVGDIAAGLPATSDPVLVAGQGDDGNVYDIHTDNNGNVYTVSAGGSTEVEGLVADDDPLGVVKPVYIGARYLSDIFASVVSAAGDAAGLVTDQFRRLHVRPAGYDSVGDAVRALIASSLADPQFMDLSQTTMVGSASSPVVFYIDMDDWEYFSVQFYQTVGTSTKEVKFYATNQDDGTAPNACNYNDVTLSWFGMASFVLAAAGTSLWWFERDTAITVRYVKVEVTLNLAAVDNTWVAYARKRRI